MREVAPRVQSEFAIVQEPVVEEEEPPEYNFEPEAADTRPTDMYLDTVRRLYRFPVEAGADDS